MSGRKCELRDPKDLGPEVVTLIEQPVTGTRVGRVDGDERQPERLTRPGRSVDLTGKLGRRRVVEARAPPGTVPCPAERRTYLNCTANTQPATTVSAPTMVANRRTWKNRRAGNALARGARRLR